MRQLMLAAALVFMASCGDDSKGPTAPNEDLVGTWELRSTDAVDVMAAGIEQFFRDLGVAEDQIDSLMADFAGEFEGDLTSSLDLTRLNPDGTLEDNSGDSGTWNVSGSELTLTYENDEVVIFTFFLDGDDLTLIATRDEILRQLKAGQEFWTEDDQLGFDVLFPDQDAKIRFFLRRRT